MLVCCSILVVYIMSKGPLEGQNSNETQTACKKSTNDDAISDFATEMSVLYNNEAAQDIGTGNSEESAGIGSHNNDEEHYSDKNASTSNGKVRKRRKVIKLCTFCRKRKLKCDRKRPMCTGCKMRGLSECVYTDGYNFDISHDDVYNKSPNLQLLNEIESLKQQLKVEGTEKHLEPETLKRLSIYGLIKKEANPLVRCKYVMKKHDRIIRYGCTSTRTIIRLSSENVTNYFQEVLMVHKKERLKLKARTGTSMLYELQRIETPWSLGMVISDLPKYSELCTAVMHSFGYKGFHLHNIFSEDKIMQYLTDCFKVVDDRIIELIPHSKLNYYPIAIVLHLYTILKDQMPHSFISFFVMLIGQNTAKICYIERVQFLLLHYIWKSSRHQSGGDNSHLLAVVELMVMSALDVGLNDSIDALQGDERILKNLWNWILFYDITIAFDIGRPLLVSAEMFDTESLWKESEPLSDEPNQEFGAAFMRKLRKFIFYGRSILNGLHTRDKIPDLDLYTNFMETLLDEIWPENIDYFAADKTLSRPLPLAEMVLSFPILSIICTLRNLKRLWFKDTSASNSNAFGKYTMMSTDLVFGSIVKCYQLDYEESHGNVMQSSSLASNLRFLIGAISSHWIRALMQGYELLYSMALSAKFINADEQPFVVNREPLPKTPISFMSYYKGFKLCSDQLRHPNLLPVFQYVSNRAPFVQMFLFERTTRLILEKIVGLHSTKQNPQSPIRNIPTEIVVADDLQRSSPLVEPVFPPVEQADIELIFNEIWRDSGVNFEDMFDLASNEVFDEALHDDL